MEILIAVFLGLWLSGASFLAYRRLKNEFRDIINNKTEKEVQR